MDEWQEAQKNERKHWEGFIANCMKGPPDFGGERFWLDLWAFQARFLWPIIEQEIADDSRILEIGGGAVGLIRWLKKGRLYSLDPLNILFAPSFFGLPLSGYNLRKDVHCFVGSAEEAKVRKATFPKEIFDLILMFDCLDHCQDPEKVLESIHHILKPKYWLCESTTTFKTKMETSAEYRRHHPWAWTEEELTKMISRANFYLLGRHEEWPCHPGFRKPDSHSDQILRIWERV